MSRLVETAVIEIALDGRRLASHRDDFVSKAEASAERRRLIDEEGGDFRTFPAERWHGGEFWSSQEDANREASASPSVPGESEDRGAASASSGTASGDGRERPATPIEGTRHES